MNKWRVQVNTPTTKPKAFEITNENVKETLKRKEMH